MKNWTLTLIIGFAGISLAFAACGDDDNGGGTDTTPADTATADTTPAPATDQCTNAADGAVIQADPDAPGSIAATCGRGSCLNLAFQDLDQFQACVLECMTDDDDGAGLTEGCSSCYAHTVRCTAENCLAAPANCSQASEACDQCIAENCTPTFVTCSGLSPSAE